MWSPPVRATPLSTPRRSTSTSTVSSPQCFFECNQRLHHAMSHAHTARHSQLPPPRLLPHTHNYGHLSNGGSQVGCEGDFFLSVLTSEGANQHAHAPSTGVYPQLTRGKEGHGVGKSSARRSCQNPRQPWRRAERGVISVGPCERSIGVPNVMFLLWLYIYTQHFAFERLGLHVCYRIVNKSMMMEK